MPVDASQALEAEHRAGAAGERLVIEDVFVQCLQWRARCFCAVAVVRDEFVETREQLLHVREVRVEPADAVSVPFDEARIVPRQHVGQQRNPADRVIGNPVLVEKTRQLAIRVQHEAVLIRPVDVAREERLDHVDRRFRRQDAGTECRNLAFQHRVKALDVNTVGLKVQQVVGVIQAVVATIRADVVVDDRQRVAQQLIDRGDRQARRAGERRLLVHAAAVAAGRLAELPQYLPAKARIDGFAVEHRRGPAQRCRSRRQPLDDFRRYLD